MVTRTPRALPEQHQRLSVGSAFVMVICVVTNAYALVLLTRITIT